MAVAIDPIRVFNLALIQTQISVKNIYLEVKKNLEAKKGYKKKTNQTRVWSNLDLV